MSQEQTIETILVMDLPERVRGMRAASCRLVQICATALPGQIELTYSFDSGGPLKNLRVQVPAEDPRVPSISEAYPCSFLYENEIHDLFNVKVEGMALDFHGNLYTTTVKHAFASTKAPVVKAAAPPVSAPAPAEAKKD